MPNYLALRKNPTSSMPNITVEEISENNMTKAAIRLLFIYKKKDIRSGMSL